MTKIEIEAEKIARLLSEADRKVSADEAELVEIRYDRAAHALYDAIRDSGVSWCNAAAEYSKAVAAAKRRIDQPTEGGAYWAPRPEV